jgi:hypothetical protein
VTVANSAVRGPDGHNVLLPFYAARVVNVTENFPFVVAPWRPAEGSRR